MEFFLLKTIPLTQNKVVTVDDSDFETLSKFSWHAAKRGQRFYAARREGWKGPMVYMHRQLVGRGGLDVDHIDGDGLNNQRKNLRAVTRLQNLCGAWKKRKGASSCFPGVSWATHAKSWKAQIRVNGKNKHLGYFFSAEQAALAYADAKTKRNEKL